MIATRAAKWLVGAHAWDFVALDAGCVHHAVKIAVEIDSNQRVWHCAIAKVLDDLDEVLSRIGAELRLPFG